MKTLLLLWPCWGCCEGRWECRWCPSTQPVATVLTSGGVHRAQGVVDFHTQLLDLGSSEVLVTRHHQKTPSAKGLLWQQNSSDSQPAFFGSYSQKLIFTSVHLRMNRTCSSTLHFCTVFLCAPAPLQFSRSVVSDSATPGTAACRTSLSITNSWSASYDCLKTPPTSPTVSPGKRLSVFLLWSIAKCPGAPCQLCLLPVPSFQFLAKTCFQEISV